MGMERGFARLPFLVHTRPIEPRARSFVVSPAPLGRVRQL